MFYYNIIMSISTTYNTEYKSNEYISISDYFTHKNTLTQPILQPHQYIFSDMLHHLCFNIRKNEIILDYKYFKKCAAPETFDMLIQYIVNIINAVMKTESTFIFHINMKSLTLTDIDKYYGFIQNISETLKRSFPNKLDKCYIYNAPFIFSQLFNTLSCFIDKPTQKKIQLV